MIRVLLFLILVGLLALAAIWLADRPGDVVIVWPWLGSRIETSLMVAAVGVVTASALSVVLWLVWRFLWRSPDLMARAARRYRRRKGHLAIARGLIAVGAGDARAALKFAAQAEKIAYTEPLALLLRAQTAQLNGDRVEAEAAFRAMAHRSDTRLLGLRGLYVEAQRRHDAAGARHYAEQAARAAPALPWAGQAVLEFRTADGDFEGALDILEQHLRSGLISRRAWKRQRAVLLTARALAAEDKDRDAIKALVFEAARLAPELVPAAALAGRLLSDAGEPRKAGKIIEAAWRRNPHPDLAEIYAHLRIGDSARDRLMRVQSLARAPAAHIEGSLAIARAAIDAREFAIARSALAPLIVHPTRRVAMLMAELEEAEHSDIGRAREWMTRAMRAGGDPAWTADGFVSDHWLPLSPVTGRLDAFEWRVPVSEIAERAAALEEAPRPYLEAMPRPEPAETPARATEHDMDEERPEERDIRPVEPPRREVVAERAPAHSPEPEAAEPEAPPPRKPEPAEAAARPAMTIEAPVREPPARPPGPPSPPLQPGRSAGAGAEPIIPLIHAPDDPGPDGEHDPLGPGARGDNWRRITSLFR